MNTKKALEIAEILQKQASESEGGEYYYALDVEIEYVLDALQTLARAVKEQGAEINS